jgi:phosphoglycolate phosphatase
VNVIFDFDGTLADSLLTILEIFNELSVIDRQLTEEDIQTLRNLPPIAAAKHLGIPLWRAPGLLVKGRAALAQRLTDLELFPGMADVLAQLDKDGHQLFVISSNSLGNVRLFLKHHGVKGHFQKLYGGVGIFGKSTVLKRVLKTHQLDPAQTYYVGDETRDVEAAKKAGVKSVAVTWGYNGTQILGRYNPDYLANKPKDLLKIVKG